MQRAVLVFAAACGAAKPTIRPMTAEVLGVTWDRGTGFALDHVAIRANATNTTSDAGGFFELGQLKPGHYKVVATHDTRSVTLELDVAAGDPMFIKLPFSATETDVDVTTDAHLDEIFRYAATSLAPNTTRIEGSVFDLRTHAAVSGSVVTAVGPAGHDATYQAVCDDSGRYQFDALPAGVYVLSAYYSVSGHGQIEVRRSDITASAQEVVVVPLVLDTAH